MRSFLKQAFLGASLMISLAAFQSVAAQSISSGRLDLHVKEIPLDLEVKRLEVKIPVPRNPPGGGGACCPGPCCSPELLAKLMQGEIREIKDMGIIAVPKLGPFQVNEFYIEFYSDNNKLKLLFSTQRKCNGCGSSLGLKTKNGLAGYLLTLDKAAAAEAQKHYVEGNKINVVARMSKGSIQAAYFVNVKEVLKK